MDQYYHNKKAQFKSNFKKDADEHLSEFLTFVSIEMNRELTGEVSDLKSAISELSDTMLSNN
ncbi:hypothetical protein [uncultured Aquimarina sp.]|uniref:hypothetical protein n=1 Tax=uncultured Aquimarina sp. TaxID=575652 RepID=UPI0026170C07|nr:hypothetical protein [uncultured Aquimarina sp.]